uniref:Uncharacterized protein n=1 Tax=Anguilla anguilla TaxID=7936 RepID=A0A0E9T9K5_ANGAN
MQMRPIHILDCCAVYLITKVSVITSIHCKF